MVQPCSDDTPQEVGVWLCTQAIAAVQQRITDLELTQPDTVMVVHGDGLPIQDVCDGILWGIVISQFPTDGSGAPFTQARIDFDLPAWATIIRVGVLGCRTVIDEDGAAVDADYETGIAARDGQYRLALMDALAYLWAPTIQPCAAGVAWGPWTPVGPLGGVSGGYVDLTVITMGLSVTGLCG